jgi:hypothetical protein
MMAFSGARAIVGSLFVAWLGRFKRMGVTTLAVQVAFGPSSCCSPSRDIYVSYVLLF